MYNKFLHVGTLLALCMAWCYQTEAQTNSPTQASEYTPWVLSAGVHAGITTHSMNFTELPGLPNCCEPYTSGSGTSLGIDIGAELITNIDLFSDKVRFGLWLGAQALPSTLTQNETVGNIIDGSTVTDGVVQHKLSLSYVGLTLQPGVVLPLPGIRNLYLMVGGIGMLPMSTNVEQQQVLESPSDQRYTFENGMRVRAQSSSELPSATSPMFWVVGGVRYSIELSEQFQLSPMVRYQQSLSSLTGATAWDVSAIQGGVALQYRLPVPATPPPPVAEPEPPPVVAPPVVHVPELRSSVAIVARTAGARIVQDTCYAPVITEYYTDTIQTIVPTLYFEYNSTVPIGGQQVLSRYVQAVRESMVDSTDQLEKVTVIGSTSANEEPRLSRERISRLLRELSINPNTISVVQVHAEQPPHPEMADEDRFVRIELGSRPRMLHRYAQEVNRMVETVELSALHTFTCGAAPCTTTITTHGARTAERSTTNPVIPLFVDAPVNQSTPENPQVVSVALRTTDAQGNGVGSDAALVLVRTVKDVHRNLVWVDPVNGSMHRGMLLALFEFDKSVPTFVDAMALDSVRSALAKGKRVTLLPSTDQFGAADYNIALRTKRADAARKLIGAASENTVATELTDIILPKSTSPQERAVLRSVWVRIE